MTRLPLASLLAALLLAAPVLAADTVTLPTEAPSRRTVDLQEVWRIDGDDEEILLGIIFAAARAPDGTVYLLDRQLSQVLVMSPDGEHLATLGRQGEGPGELNRPHGLFLMEDGAAGAAQVAVVQGFPGKVTLLDGDGNPGGTITIGGDAQEGGFNFIRELHPCGDRLVGVRGRSTFDMETGRNTSVSTLSIMDRTGRELVAVVEHERENDLNRFVFDEAAEFSELRTFTAGPDGRVYTAPERDAWQVAVRDLDGAVVRVLSRPFETRKRTDEDKEELVRGVNVMINGVRQDVENKALDRDPAIGGLDVAADGRLFVRNCWQRRELLPEGVAGRYDVIAPDGAFVEELTLRLPGFDNEQDRLVFLDGEHWLLIENFDSAQESAFAPPAAGDEEASAPTGAEPLSVIYLRAS